MPVTSSSSSVHKWPSPDQVLAAARAWAEREAARRADLLRLGYYGSYARGDAGFGSDLDWVAVVEDSEVPFERRALAFDLLPLPVPAEIVVYTRDEWARMQQEGGRFIRTLETEAVWLVDKA